MLRTILTALAITIASTSTTGCAVLLTGYLVGQGMADSKREKECRANLQIQNEQRIKEGKDAFPDMCSK